MRALSLAVALLAILATSCAHAGPRQGGVAQELAEPTQQTLPEEAVAAEVPQDEEQNEAQDESLTAGDIYLISAPDAVLQQFGTDQALDPTSEVCLAAGEIAVFASERILFEAEGAECIEIAVAEATAYGIALLMTPPADPSGGTEGISGGAASPSGVVVNSSGPSSDRFPVGIRISEPITLRAGDQVTVLTSEGTRVLRGPGVFSTPAIRGARSAAMILSNPTRSRSGAVRGGARSTSGSRPIIFRVASGTASVLERLPRGTPVARNREICLREGEQITIIGSNGQRANYSGPGCARRNSRPTSENLGGFTFGWNRFGVRPEAAALP